MDTRQFDLVVLSHLRWDGVWQRPQQLISRVARHARRTWFVEEPIPTTTTDLALRCESADPVTRVVLDVPLETVSLGFNSEFSAEHRELVAAACGELVRPIVWLYTPLGLPLAERLNPSVLVYDVMDDLAAFREAAEELPLRHAQALAAADLVFTGGRSLHRNVVAHRRRPAATMCFPSGVEPQHFSRTRPGGCRRVAGYVGVIDERLDLQLIADLADRLPDWTIRMVGPVTKIDEAQLPARRNIEYTGKKSYRELPDIMAGLDVALMPFALNAATKSISPTKTLEYLAAGLPVVSTQIADVVRDYSGIVHFADDAHGFAAFCTDVEAGDWSVAEARVREILAAQHWDAIAERMVHRLRAALDTNEAASATA